MCRRGTCDRSSGSCDEATAGLPATSTSSSRRRPGSTCQRLSGCELGPSLRRDDGWACGRRMPEAAVATESLDRVLVPRVPALVAGFRDVLWLSPEGEIEALSPAEARARLNPIQGGETPMVCHARAVARRLDIPLGNWPGFAAFDLLELFAFVRPAQFCVPTPRGLAAALGLVPPRDMAEACVALATAARALLQELANETSAEVRAVAEIAERAGWPWGPAVLAALPAVEPGAQRRAPGPMGGLR